MQRKIRSTRLPYPLPVSYQQSLAYAGDPVNIVRDTVRRLDTVQIDSAMESAGNPQREVGLAFC